MADQNKKQNDELDLEKTKNVAGGYIKAVEEPDGNFLQKFFGKTKTTYEVYNGKNHERAGTYNNVTDASIADENLNA